MKKFIIFLALTLSSLTAFSQTEYPKIQTDSSGMTLVIMTVEQAQELDNATDLLELLEKANAKIADLDSMFIRVVAENERVIAEQALLVKDLKKQSEIKEMRIATLLSEVSTYQSKAENLEKDIKNLEKQNQERDKEIKRLNFKVLINKSFGAAAMVAVALIAIL